jgi:hypothetical protein
MRLILPDNFGDNDKMLMQRCGYFLNQDPNTGKLRYLRRLSQTQFYPRFHLSLEHQNNQIVINLHLDMKKASYQGTHAHSGEHDTDNVMAEIDRIKNLLLPR